MKITRKETLSVSLDFLNKKRYYQEDILVFYLFFKKGYIYILWCNKWLKSYLPNPSYDILQYLLDGDQVGHFIFYLMVVIKSCGQVDGQMDPMMTQWKKNPKLTSNKQAAEFGKVNPTTKKPNIIIIFYSSLNQYFSSHQMLLRDIDPKQR